MNRVKCILLERDLDAMDRAPYPGELGKKILDNVSKQGWQKWLEYQTMLINENNLNLMDPDAQLYLKDSVLWTLKFHIDCQKHQHFLKSHHVHLFH